MARLDLLNKKILIPPKMTAEEILELRRVLAKLKGYTVEDGDDAGPMAFNAFSPPDASESGAQVKKKRMGFKSQHGEG